MYRLLCAAAVASLSLAPSAALAAAKKSDGRTLLKMTVEPPSAIYIDGKLRVQSGHVKTVELTPGRHLIRVVHKRDEHEEQVVLKKGETTEWGWKFEDEPPPKPAPSDDSGGEQGGAQGAAPAGGQEGAAPEGNDSHPGGGDTMRDPGESFNAHGQDPAPDAPKRGAKQRPAKKDPLEGFDPSSDAPPKDPP